VSTGKFTDVSKRPIALIFNIKPSKKKKDFGCLTLKAREPRSLEMSEIYTVRLGETWQRFGNERLL